MEKLENKAESFIQSKVEHEQMLNEMREFLCNLDPTSPYSKELFTACKMYLEERNNGATLKDGIAETNAKEYIFIHRRESKGKPAYPKGFLSSIIGGILFVLVFYLSAYLYLFVIGYLSGGTLAYTVDTIVLFCTIWIASKLFNAVCKENTWPAFIIGIVFSILLFIVLLLLGNLYHAIVYSLAMIIGCRIIKENNF